MTGEVAEFTFSKVSAYLEVVIETLLACALLLLASYVIGDVTGLVLWFGVLAVYGAGIIFLSRVLLRLRYRYILDIRYVVGRDGISVEENGAQEILNWNEFAKAEYMPIITTYRLWAAGKARPVVLIAIGGLPGAQTDRRNRLAGSLLKDGLGNRLKSRWLPW